MAAAIIYVAAVRSYFFLFDDFALIGEASTKSVQGLLTLPFFGFYRPLVFLLTKAEFQVYGWTSPGGYLATSLVVHICNAGVMFGLARKLSLDYGSCLAAAVLMLLSPWATEPYFWLSGRFDLLATFGITTALLFGLVFVQLDRGGYVVAIAGCAAASIAFLSKEVSATLPALSAMVIAVAHGRHALLRRRAIVYVGISGMLALSYLVVRERLLPTLGGAYGNLPTLLRSAPVLYNVLSFVRAVVFVPWPQTPAVGGYALSTVAGWVAAGAAITLGCRAALINRRLVLLGLFGFMVAVAPVVWVTLNVGTSSNGRFLYAASPWIALTLASGTGSPSRPGRDGLPLWSNISTAAFGLLLAHSLVSITYQTLIWNSASRIARDAVSQISPYMNSPQPIFISNLPYLFVEGPYVLKEYAFGYFTGSERTPVRVRRMMLRYDRATVIFAGWADSTSALAGERVVTLKLPVVTLDGRPVARLEAPVTGTVTDVPFMVRGWAVDAASQLGTGVDLIHVYAYPISGEAAVFLGAAHYGEARPDVGRSVGQGFTNSGFSLRVQALSPGPYRVVVYMHDTVTGEFSALTAEVTVR